MDNNLSERYLLYLRDMSRKVAFGSASGGDYAQVLITAAKRKTKSRFQRITNINLADLRTKGEEAYRRELDQEKIGNGIFCGVGILAGTYTKKVGAKNSLRLIAAQPFMDKLSLKKVVNAKYQSGLSITILRLL